MCDGEHEAGVSRLALATLADHAQADLDWGRYEGSYQKELEAAVEEAREALSVTVQVEL